jgi:hypothetical protein
MRTSRSDSGADPFHERLRTLARTTVRILGGRCEFEYDDARLRTLVERAYADLPVHRLGSRIESFRIALRLDSRSTAALSDEPPAMRLHGHHGLLCGMINASNFAVLAPEERKALVVFSPELLRRAYHARYELLEFAVYTLLARGQELVPLHAACIASRGGKCVLLIGESGAGKSTIALHCLMRGLQFVAEDSTFVLPRTMKVTGLPTYLHLQENSLRFLASEEERKSVLRFPKIRRRSGVEKLEIDIRQTRFRMAAHAPELSAVIMLSTKTRAAKAHGAARLLRPMSERALMRSLRSSQPYAAGQPAWSEFLVRMARVRGFELCRGKHPDDAVDELAELLN